MKAIILGAGIGSRLQPLTLDKPKCLVEINGSSLLSRQLSLMESYSINPIKIVGGYKINQLREIGPSIIENNQYATSNMLWSLFSDENEISGELIVSYGDIVFPPLVLEKLISETSDISVVIDMAWKPYWQARGENILEDAETLKLDDRGYIKEIGLKPESLSQIDGQYIGLMKFSEKGTESIRDIFERVKKKNGLIRGKELRDAYMTDFLQHVIDCGIKVKSVPIECPWVEIDTISDFENVVTHKRIDLIDKEIELREFFKKADF